MFLIDTPVGQNQNGGTILVCLICLFFAEPMLRLLSGNRGYRETHNALFDALDELEILRLLGQNVACYCPMNV